MKFPSEWVVRRAWPIITVFLLGSLLFAIPLRNIEIDPEIKNQLPEDMPARRDVHAIEEEFGGSELVMIVLSAPDVLDPAVLERLQKLSEGLAAVPTVDRVVSPFTLTDIRGTPDGMMTVEPAISSIPASAEEAAALKRRLESNPLVFGNVLARDFSAAAVIGLSSTEATDSETIAAINQVIAAAPGPGEVQIGGMPDVRLHVSEDIRSDIRRFAPLGILIIVGFLFFTLRQARGVGIPFTVQILSILVSMGLIPLLGWKVQMVTVTLPVILLAIGNDHTVHLVARYQEENLPGTRSTGPALTSKVLSEIAFPVLTAGITTVAGFLCLLTHVVIPAAQLGVLSAVGLGFVMIAAVTLAPAMMSVLPVPKPLPGMGEAEGGGWIDRVLRANARWVIHNRGLAVGGSVLVALIASAGLPWLEVDTNPVNYYPQSAPVAVTARAINQHFGGSTEISVMIEGDISDPAVMKQVDALETDLRKLPQVGYTMSIARVVRTMNQAVSGGADKDNAVPTSREAISQLFMLYSMGGNPEDFEHMVDPDFERALVTARINSLSTGQIAAVVDHVREYTAREMPETKVVVGGFGAVFADLVDAIVDGQTSSLVISFVVVLILNAIGFWSLEAGAWSMIPLLVAVPALFGLMGTFGIELNVVTAMLSSIMIGVGVDYTVHFLWRYREERRHGHPAEHAAYLSLTTVGRGIVFNALSVVLGFAILAFSNFLPVQFFGFLVVISIAGCMFAAMILMPALVVMLRPRFAEPLPGREGM